MFKHLTIDTEQNKLLCSTELIGKGELVEVFTPDEDSPPQAVGRILQKVGDPGVFVIHTTFDGNEFVGRRYDMGPRCVFRVLKKNVSGKRRRKFPSAESAIVDTEKDENFVERRVSRAKTGSVRRAPRSNP
jgi:hypothetical protein